MGTKIGDIKKFQTNDKGNVKNRCPICGYEFEENEVQTDIFECKGKDCCIIKTFTLDELFTDEDDYAYCK